MLDELDFTKEAANQETFRVFLKDSGIHDEVTAPKVFPEVSTKRVLTMVRAAACVFFFVTTGDVIFLESYAFLAAKAGQRDQPRLPSIFLKGPLSRSLFTLSVKGCLLRVFFVTDFVTPFPIFRPGFVNCSLCVFCRRTHSMSTPGPCAVVHPSPASRVL